MHSPFFLTAFVLCSSFFFAEGNIQPSASPAPTSAVANASATSAASSTPAVDPLSHLATSSSGSSAAFTSALSEAPASMTSTTPVAAASAAPVSSASNQDALPLPNSRLNIPNTISSTSTPSPQAVAPSPQASTQAPQAAAQPPQAVAQAPQPDASTTPTPLKKEGTPLTPNALARLRAARAKLQALQASSQAANSQPGSSNANKSWTTYPTNSTTAANASPSPSDIPSASAATPPSAKLDDKVSMQFPHTSIMEILALYEKLTGKRIIRDSNLAGSELSIMIADPISKKDAINVIESSMLLNGYYIIPVDEKTVKVLGPQRPPRTEGLPLYLEESELPVDSDQLASFYQPLHFLSTSEAINILQGVVQLNQFGSLVAVPNTSAIVITDKTPVIRKALALLKVIDHESSQIITEFVSLQRADAEKTVETLNQIFGKDNASTSTTPKSPGQPGSPTMPPNSQPPISADSSNPGDERVFSGKVQFIADKRTNRILVVTRAENYRYVRELIANLDKAQTAEEPLVRPLNYISSTDIFPVLVDMLKNKDDDSTQNQAKTQATPQNAFNNSGSSSGGSSPFGTSQSSTDASGSSSGLGSSGVTAGGSHSDRLNETQKQPPLSAIVGSTSILADPTANSIIVYGPADRKAKASQILDLLDRRPQQVYLAAVIGEMKLDASTDFGASYLVHYQGFQTLLNSFPMTGPAGPALLNGINTAFPGAGGLTNALVSSAFANAAGVNSVANASSGGLTMFGSIGGSVDTYANFLESTGKFRTISRPVVYTSNNKKATILSGRKVPYQSSTLSSVVAGGAVGATNQTANSITANVTYQDVLLKLEVIPLVNSDKEINLIIAQQNQSVDDTATAKAVASGVNAPVVNTQELTTSVRIPSGSTIVLGGLISDENDSTKTGIPLLDKVPVLGPLLGSHTAKSKTRRELVIMIQPIVIDSNNSMEKASDLEGGVTNLGKEGKEFEKKLQPTPTPTPKKKKFKLFGLPKMNDF